MNQHDIENSILTTADQLEEATEQLGATTQEAAEAEVHYKRKYAITFLQIEGGPVAERVHRATVQCADEYFAMKTKEAQARSQSEVCRMLRARLDAFRTVSANLREAGG